MKIDNQKSPYDALPNEIFLHIAQFFSTNTLINAAQVSKSWHKKITDNYTWDNQLESYQKTVLKKYGLAWPEIPPQRIDNQLPYYQILAQLRSLEKRRPHLFFNCFSTENPHHMACWYGKLGNDYNLSSDVYTHILNLAASCGNFTLVKWLVDEKRINFKPTDNTLTDAISTGNQALVEWLVNEHHLILNTYYLHPATNSGNLALIKWLINEKQVSTQGGIMKFTLHGAASSGNLALVQWLADEKQIAVDSNLINTAARSGNIELVRWLIEEKNLRPTNFTLETAAASGNLNLVQWLIFEKKLRLTQDFFNKAIESGNTDLIKYVFGDNMHELLNTVNLDWVAEQGKFAVVQLIIDKKIKKPSEFTLERAAKVGNIALVKWLIEDQKVSPNGSTLYRAIESANLALIKYLIDVKSVELDPYALNIVTRTRDPGAVELVKTYLDAQKKSESETADNSATRRFTHN